MEGTLDMNEKFFKLSKEKQLSIINAGLEVFAKNEYKRASTEEIAAKAGISKGLLFYYFKNKKEFYLYLYNYCEAYIRKIVEDDSFYSITDFFILLDYCAEKKAILMEQFPYLMDFCLRTFYSDKEDVSDVLHKKYTTLTDSYQLYFSRLDLYKFKEEIKLDELYHMLIWMADGYMNEKRRTGDKITVEILLTEFKKWSSMLKKISYKEEYLCDECN